MGPEAPLHRRSKRTRALTWAAVAACLLGGLVAVGLLLGPAPDVSLVAGWTSHLRTPLVDDNLAAAGDRDALASGDYFAHDTFHLDRSLSAELLRSALATEAVENSAARVVYVSGYATRDAKGAVVLMTKEFMPLKAEGGLPLAELLQQLRDSGPPTLLVLDLSFGVVNGQHALLPCGVGEEIHAMLQRESRPDLVTLVGCSPGESVSNLAGAGRSTFGYFFEAGLAGAADGYNPSALTDSRVSARELAAYVCDRVKTWTRRYGPAAQTPRAVALDDVDFVVTACRRAPHGAAPVPAAEEYPVWLREAWDRRDAWLAAGANHTMPRLLKRYEADVLDAERRWRSGADSSAMNKLMASNARSLIQEQEDAQRLLEPDATVSLARWELAVGPAPAELTAAWRAALEAPAPPAPAVSEALVALRTAADKAAPEANASAAVAALMQSDGDFTAQLAMTHAELSRGAPEPRFVETDTIARLAELLSTDHDLPATLLREVVHATLLREKVWADAKTMAWVAGSLARADRQRRTALAMLLSPGFASRDQSQQLCETATHIYHGVENCQSRLRAALSLRDRAMRVLPLIAPQVRLHASLRNDWAEAAALTEGLADAIDALPRDATLAELDGNVEAIRGLGLHLESLLRSLLKGASNRSTDALAESLRQGLTDQLPSAEALLATPLLGAAQRERLCLAACAAAAAQAEPLQDFAEQNSKTILVTAARDSFKFAAPTGGDATTVSGPNDSVAEARFTAAVLRLAGFQTTDLDAPIEQAAANPTPESLQALLAALRAQVQDAFARISAKPDPTLAERACRVLPAECFSNLLDARLASPTLLAELDERAAARKLNAGRLLAESRDLIGSIRLAEAAQSLDDSVVATLPRVVDDKPTGSKPLELTSLSEHQTTESLTFQVQCEKGADLAVDVLQPTNLLRVEKKLTPHESGAEVELKFRVRDDATYAQLAATYGVLLRLAEGDHVRHLPLPIPAIAAVSPVEVSVEYAGVRRALSKGLVLPPTAASEPLRLFVKNRTDGPLGLEARVQAGALYTASLSLKAKGEAPLKLAAPAAAAPATGPAAVAANDPVALSSIRVAIVDTATNHTVYKQSARPTIAEPTGYIRVLGARVTPDESGVPVARLRLERLPGAPDPLRVEAAFVAVPAGEVPLVAGGELATILTAKRGQATLQASLSPPVGGDPTLRGALSINGVSRSMVWEGDTPAFGGSAELTPRFRPIVDIAVPEMLAAGDVLNYSVDASPVGADCSLQVALLRAGSAGGIVRERSFATARARRLEMGAQLVEGALPLRTVIGPQADAFETTGLAGRYTLVAAVFDERGAEIARSTRKVVIDADPAGLATLSLPTKPAVGGAPLAVTVDAQDDLSGVGQVRLYVGVPVGGAPPKGAAIVPAVADPHNPSQWVAAVPMPEGTPGASLTAEVTNGVGLVRNIVQSVELLSAEAASMGKIAGMVTEGARPQPGLAVELRDPEQKPVAEAQTDAEGRFSFDAVKPGKYLLWSVKHQSQRVGSVGVDVEAAATTSAAVELSL
ncbi:hypothetical protein Mal64_04630 [Pseudobythopirellula maris]|uniref:Uncharacterized protein n=1 Tax=Pseudobythopirellula maris TaxID=2527991 RepID=A0A5C5ZS05_9BACT|nr:carboxypeptidase-like regulatory domain-containing protein [Pseudobythopirellula maris]TWT90080.1 hypothetical protein Mal64_04630 [Pseudobythopirellula maris]